MQQIQLSIPEPCHEDWQQMTPTQQGRFCNACAKQVVDFSTMSDAEVLNYFSGIKNEKVCGRAYPDQLERAITIPVYPKKKLFWYWNYITMFFLFFAKSNTTKAQGGMKVITEQKINTNKAVDINTALQGRLGGMVMVNASSIKGKIVDESGIAIAGASVVIKGANQVAVTDADGLYKLNANTKNHVLEITALGFEKKEVVLNKVNPGDIVLTKLERMALGEVVIVGGVMSTDYTYTPVENPKHTVVLEVTDNATMQPVNKAAVTINKTENNGSTTAYTDKKGIYKLRRINENEIYTVTIKADGYKEEVLKIKGSDLNERKIIKQIFLEKEATLSDYKKMDSVVINSYAVVGRLKRYNTTCETVTMGAMLSGITITTTFEDTLRSIAAKITGAVKISPNPVAKGNSFNLSLKLKQTGTHKIQITDAAGRIILLKQINAAAKLYTEQVQTSAAWSSGIYRLSIINDKNILLNTVSFSIR